ncbi:replication factor C subunit 1-like isoform X2 [Ornithodoros turicata]|uniref:replication factor C subunit 1-like isoform X2 n=1 Tax=Ornithodoros turicata TaxID=34597 RepID=UPI003139CD8A
MDIRRFFTPAGATKRATPSDTKSAAVPAKSEKVKDSSDSKGKKKETTKSEKKDPQKKKRRRLILADSDSDEEPVVSKKKSASSVVLVGASDDDSEKPLAPKTLSPKKEKIVTPKKVPASTNGDHGAHKKLTRVSVDDFFGSSPVAVSSKSSKLEVKLQKSATKTTEEHDDETFQKTLGQLDHTVQQGTRTSPRKKAAFKDPPRASPGKETSPRKKGAAKEPDRSQKVTPEKGESLTKAPEKVHSKPGKQAAVKEPEKSQVVTTEKGPEKGHSKPGRKKPESRVEFTVEKKTPPKSKPEPVAAEEKETKPSSGKKRGGGGLGYRSYLDREGPRLLGTRDIPEGSPGCLRGITMVITGVLECVEKDEIIAIVQKCGAKVTSSVSRNTTYLVTGRDSGPAKIRKAEECKVQMLDEEGLYNLIETKSGKTAKKESPEASIEGEDVPKKKSMPTKRKVEQDLESLPPEKKEKLSPEKNATRTTPEPAQSLSQGTSQSSPTSREEMWVDKYKPKSTKQIIGQQGDKSNCHKLSVWLRDWHKNRLGPKKPPPKWMNSGGGDGSSFRAALLSGAPGVGKTTTATLVCKEAGFDMIEMNASDTRSKKSLKQEVSELLGNRTISGSGTTPKHVLIMDEVDGMAGNEDRGGVQELIALIKSTKVPIICICNDRSHPKMRSLVNHCFDLRFYRPQVKQIQASMMSIAYKEGIKVTPAAVQEIIVASNQDVRQVLHNLSLWSARTKGLSIEQAKSDAGKGTKDIKMGPFDVIKKILCSSEGGQNMNLIEKSALFFHDYSMVPMFVQDNYVHVQPLEAKGDIKKHLRLLSETSNSICEGDLIEKQIRSSGTWGLLPMQAIFSSVIPGELMRGHLREMINFPAWFGKNSSTGKRQRLLQDLHMHMHTRISGNRTQLNMDYLGPLRSALTGPLIERENGGVPEVVNTMNHYYLQRADLDTIVELSVWTGMKDPMTQVNSKVKATLTRTLNKEGGRTPFVTEDIVKKKGKKGAAAPKSSQSTEVEGAEDDNEAEEDSPDLTDINFD